MVPIYDAAHSVDAHMMKSLLEQAGIPAQIRGEYLQGALGEIPVSGQITVCVADADAARARALVLDWERATPEPDALDDDTQDTPGHTAPASPGRGHLMGLAGGLLLVLLICWAVLRPLV